MNNTVRNTTQTVQGTVGGVTQTTTQAVQGVVNSLPAQPAPTTTQAATPAPAQTTASTPQPAPGPVQQVVQDTTSALGGLLGGR